jgi:methionyl aminopeptidase
MSINDEKDLEALRRIGRIVADCLRHMRGLVEPGMTTKEIDDLGRGYLDRHGARSAPELTYNFPGATCISVGSEAAHGIPGTRRVRAGELVNIDVSAELDGYFADTGGSFVVPPVKPELERLCLAAREVQAAAMFEARADRPLDVIGTTIEREARKRGYKVIENLCSHGVGRALHEEPKEILPFSHPGERRRLTEGLVITIEPFVSTGPRFVHETGDGWTLAVDKKHFVAQFEHTIVITKGEPIVLTA